MNYVNKEWKGLNCDGIGKLCAQGTIYHDISMQPMKYDLVVGDGNGASIYDANNTRIEWCFNVNDNSHTPVVVDKSEFESILIYLDFEDDEDEDESNTHDTINEDSNCKKDDNNNKTDCDDNSNNNSFDNNSSRESPRQPPNERNYQYLELQIHFCGFMNQLQDFTDDKDIAHDFKDDAGNSSNDSLNNESFINIYQMHNIKCGAANGVNESNKNKHSKKRSINIDETIETTNNKNGNNSLQKENNYNVSPQFG